MNAVDLTENQRRVLAALDAPLSVRELSEKIRHENREEWAHEQGLTIDWEDPPLGATIMALARADRFGLYHPMPWHLYPVLRSLERSRLIERIQIEGQRPMLWVRRES